MEKDNLKEEKEKLLKIEELCSEEGMQLLRDGMSEDFLITEMYHYYVMEDDMPEVKVRKR